MKNIAAMEMDLARARYDVRVLIGREKQTASKIISAQINALTNKINKLQVTINQRKQYEKD
jgi:hypothetical protein